MLIFTHFQVNIVKLFTVDAACSPVVGTTAERHDNVREPLEVRLRRPISDSTLAHDSRQS